MNSRPHQPSDLSQSDANLLAHLTDLAATIEPDPTFKVDLEAQLRQTHRANSPQGNHPMNFVLPRLTRRAALFTCASLAIATALMVPTLSSGRATGWLAALLNSGTDSNVNAQTLAQAFATGRLTIMADSQEANQTTQEVVARGNAILAYPDAQIQAKADRINYVPTSGELTLSGNVEISQRGENLRGSQARCSLIEKQCSLTQK